MVSGTKFTGRRFSPVVFGFVSRVASTVIVRLCVPGSCHIVTCERERAGLGYCLFTHWCVCFSPPCGWGCYSLGAC